ncbi:hypothetical protein Aperf_G00000100439 [Anoplocephala perfoliata]
MKARFETFDVIAIVSELKRSIVGCRLVNAYDANNKTYMLKLSSSAFDDKPVLLIESGVRMHLTSFSWPKNAMPLGFTMKLRKHIKNKKISNIQQLGIDRIVDITFGFEEYAYHLIVELYGRGNVFLTDANYTILHLLRPRTDVDQDVRYATRERFPIELVRPVPESLIDLWDPVSLENLIKSINNLLINASGPWNNGISADGKELPSAASVIGSAFSYGLSLIEHCCFLAGLTNVSRPKTVENDGSVLNYSDVDADAYRLQISEKIANALRNVLIQITEKRQLADDGFVAIPAVIVGISSPLESGKLSKYEAYYPIQFAQLALKPKVNFDTFNKAVDEFYSSMEIKKSEAQVIQHEKSANKKVENIKRDQENRIRLLKEEQVKDNQKAQLLELNMELVDRVIVALNSAIANQTNWKVLEEVLAKQKESGDDPVANCIVHLQLSSNQALLRLSDPYQEDEGEIQTQDVLIDLDSTALQNAQKYYSNRRQAEIKERKTITGTKIALKAATKKAEKSRKDVHMVPKVFKTRKPYWFEKFHWFISSDNYLVLAGRDAVQNENLIKKYFRQHDIYVHADVHGASSIVVKARSLRPCEKSIMEAQNQLPNQDTDESDNAVPQPPLRTLIEAGQMAVALSNAWSAKIITNAWWVRYDQVSKTAPSGEFLTTGSFVIRGRKNMLPQCHLTYGIGILFKLGEDSVERHVNERCIDLEAIRDAEAAIKKYEVPKPQTDNSEEEEDNETTKAFENVTLNLNINKVMKPQVQVSKQRKKSNQQAKQTPPAQPQNKTKPSGPTPLKRGQKAKMKRIKQKYADQDYEERQIRQQILQGANAKLSAVHDFGKSPRKQESVQSDDEQMEKNELEEMPPQDEVESSDSGSENNDDSGKKDMGKFEIPEADVEQEEEALVGTAEVSTMETLTGLPTPEDTLLYAVPFCAPFSALQKYKYKAKLIPGTQKRGKITKLAIHHFTSDKGATDLERQLIQAIKEEDVCRVMPGSAKIMFPADISVQRDRSLHADFIDFDNSTLKVSKASVTAYGVYQRCSSTTCSRPIYVEIQRFGFDLSEQRGKDVLILNNFKGDFTWIFDGEPGSYSYKAPATELKCQFALLKQFVDIKVIWTYTLSFDATEDIEIRKSDTLSSQHHIRSHFLDCDSRFTCYQSSLFLLRNPGNRLYTCWVSAQSSESAIIGDKQVFQTAFHKPGHSQKVLLFEHSEDLDIPEEDVDYVDRLRSLRDSPNITLSLKECSSIVNISCSAYASPIELYVTSDSMTLDRYNDFWYDLPLNRLSKINLTVTQIGEYYICNSTFDLSAHEKSDIFVVCRCLHKYGYRRLDIPACPTQPFAYQWPATAALPLSLLPLIASVIRRCRIRPRKRRPRGLVYSRRSLLYHSDKLVGSTACLQRRNYANVSLYCPRHYTNIGVNFSSSLEKSNQGYAELKTRRLQLSSLFHAIHLNGARRHRLPHGLKPIGLRLLEDLQ